MGRLMYAELSRPVRVLASSVVTGSLVVTLAACATPAPPNPVAAAPVQARSTVVASMAFGPWEEQIAPAATRAEVVAGLVEQQYKTGRITRGAAKVAHAALVRALAALEDARRDDKAAPTPENRAALAEAIRLTDQAANLLEP